jgi:hypothetical protein
MRHFDEDYEIDAIEKCSRALMRLDDRTKIRVIRYLLDKFGLIAQTDSQPQEVVNNIIHNQQNNLVLAEPKAVGSLTNNTSNLFQNGTYIALKDVLIKNLAKSEPELMVIIGYYNSEFGKSTFTKQSILDSYRDNGIVSESRKKNLGHNVNSLIKKSLFSTITDEELSITPEGCEYAQNILSGNSTTKKRKPRLKKAKSTKEANDEVFVEEETNDLDSDE